MDSKTLDDGEKAGTASQAVTKTYLERLSEFEREAFTQPTLTSLLQLDAAKFMRIGEKMHELFAAKLQRASSEESLDRARPALDGLLKISRQVDRLVRLSNDLQDH